MAEESVDLRKERAKSSTSPAELEKLAEDKDENVRKAVAENVNTPVSLLEKLAGDKDEEVRNAAAENENTPTSALEKKTATDDKALEKTVEKINNWISESGKPIRCFSDYTVWENEQEDGTFTVKKDGESEEIEGYIMWENKTSVILTWELPDSSGNAIETLEKDDWSDDEIEYDEHEWSGSSEGKSSQDFDDKDNPIVDYDDFEGGGITEVVAFGSSYGPYDITITYENQKGVVFESDEGDSWTVKIDDGQPETIPNYEEVLVLVRKLLK